MTVREELIKQLNATIIAIKTINQKNPTSMVKNILIRYEEAKDFIQHSSDEQFEEGFYKVKNKLDTLTRGYLDSANDYMKSMLRETENLQKRWRKV
ncbi:hypothetical protein MOD48_05050 [Bacillus spizizenii]|uniref:hypothetical protein n=1 Tax=Bacillus spizizenii TaxID=96241 RepID=UPI0005CA923F|nr:hypothetical protein [Bacillus spizizenii]MCY7761842.1 hypothetical protein [Bacillus spizizenii]MCY7825268.1 hypothetical protein [Bacillus spizizenii]MCY7830980.1 hypothetical protein [Bacillus spizizenii]MCY7875467.1 hypothetical protein [Bacillus spizizenii]MCY7883976.1 hypothetical protein [Bacillus spizizenii]